MINLTNLKFLLLLLIFFTIKIPLKSQNNQLLDLELIIRDSEGEVSVLKNKLNPENKTLIIAFQGASCNKCIKKAYKLSQKVYGNGLSVIMLSDYGSTRVQQIVEREYCIKNIYSTDVNTIKYIVSNSKTPILILVEYSGKVTKKEYIDDRDINDILDGLKL